MRPNGRAAIHAFVEDQVHSALVLRAVFENRRLIDHRRQMFRVTGREAVVATGDNLQQCIERTAVRDRRQVSGVAERGLTGGVELQQ